MDTTQLNDDETIKALFGAYIGIKKRKTLLEKSTFRLKERVTGSLIH
jgi:hypothetical protein